MGIAQWLLELGINAESVAEKIGTRAGVVPLQWPVGDPLAMDGLSGPPKSLIYRLPRDAHQRASIFAKEQVIVVNEAETAIVLEDGKSKGQLLPGRYTFKKSRVVGALDVVWMKTGQYPLNWGIGNVLSSDGIQIGATGTLYVRVLEASTFNTEIVQGAVVLTELDLKRFLLPRIQAVLRTVVARTGALDLQMQREAFTEAVMPSVGEALAKMGLEGSGFEVVEISLPPEFKAAVAAATVSTQTAKAAIVEANTRSQVAQIEAVGTAQAQLTVGLAQVQVMATMAAQGIDPLKLKALEALNTLAANPGQGVNVGGDPRSQLIGQVAVAALATPGAPIPPLPAQIPATTTQAPPTLTPAAAAQASETPDDIEKQIDGLTQQLSEGKLSEETYKKLVDRLEAKLARLRGAGS